MRVPVSLICAVFAVAALADGAAAATTVNGSKSNSMDMAATDTDAACTAKGGVVSRARGRVRTCTTPPSACRATTVNASKSNSSLRIDTNDVAAVAACLDACGTIKPGPGGVMMCSKPAPAAAPATR